MNTTLIVRDAVLAINGAPEKRGDPRQHLGSRVNEVANMKPATTEECLEVLLSAAGGKEPEPDVLEALVVVGLAHPHLAARKGFVPVAMGRRLAARLERMGESERALVVLEMLAQANPGDAGLDRDLSALLRRQGMVQDLGDRYFERAVGLMREGRDSEAIGWLREVLQLDRGRKDAARLIRDLRLKDIVAPVERRGIRLRWILGVLLLAGALGALGWHEYDLYERFRTLPGGVPENLQAQEARLLALEEFTEAHPVWHGAILAVKERTELRLDVRRLRTIAEAQQAERAKQLFERNENAEAARERALSRASSQDFRGALDEFQKALEFASEDWPERAQVQAEIEALTHYLESGE